MLRSVEVQCAAVQDDEAKIFAFPAYFCVMSFFRIKTINGRDYLYRQTSKRKGKKVLSIMEYVGALGAIAVAAASPGKPGGYSGHRSTDKRQIRDQEGSDRKLFGKDRAAFNIKLRQDYERQQKIKENAKQSREEKLSEAAKSERANARQEAERKTQATMEAVRAFNEARSAEKEN